MNFLYRAMLKLTQPSLAELRLSLAINPYNIIDLGSFRAIFWPKRYLGLVWFRIFSILMISESLAPGVQGFLKMRVQMSKL